MNNFLYLIYNFLRDLNSSLTGSLNTDAVIRYNDFLGKSVFYETSLIAINITYLELIFYLGTWFIAILVIVLFIKFICKIVGLFRLWLSL